MSTRSLKTLLSWSRYGLCLVLLASVNVCGPDTSTNKNGNNTAFSNWLHHGNTHAEQRFSPLTQINSDNIGQLGLAWFQDIPNARSLPATPLAVDGVLYYAVDFGAAVFAVDGKSGDVKWQFNHRNLTPDRMRMNRGENRGVAYEDGRVFMASQDGLLHAIDARTGELLWQARTFPDGEPRYITGAPRVFDGKVIIGHGGADQGARGYVSTYDTQSGKLLWRFYTVPGNPADGFEDEAMAMAAKTWTGEWWKYGGGGTVWNAITYDEEFDRVYIGTSNGVPFDPALRSPDGGDNLFLCSIVALDANSGEYVWHYQVNPREAWDYKATMDMILADLDIGGELRKVLMQAPSNGFFYLLDREDGKLISAEKWGGKVNWASHIDLTTGRPVEAENIRYEEGMVEMWPSVNGAHNYQPMSYNPITGLAYIPHLEAGNLLGTLGKESSDARHLKYMGTTRSTLGGIYFPSDYGGGSLVAYDPINQREVWRDNTDSFWNGGTMTTAGNLVFYGTALGEFAAYDAGNGEKLWSFDAGLGIISAPISYAIEGTQYIALLVGYGATAGLGISGYRHGWKYGLQPRRLLVFALDGDRSLPATAMPDQSTHPILVEDFVPDTQKVQRGTFVYHNLCAGCHGVMLNAESVGPDLRESLIASNPGAFDAYVRHGLPDMGMPQFSDLSESTLEDMFHFIRYTAMGGEINAVQSDETPCPACGFAN